MKKLTALVLGAAMTASMAAAVNAADVTIKLATTKNSGSYTMDSLEKMAAKIAEESGDTIEVQIYPDSQLGGQNEQIEGMGMGTIEMALIAAGAEEGFYAPTGLMGTLFTAQNEDHALKMYSSEKAAEIFEAAIPDTGVRALDAFVIEGARNVWSKEPIEKLSDLEGLKMRVPEVPMFINSFESLGVNPTPMALSEVYTALQTGIVDGLEFDMTSVVDWNFYDHCKYCYETNHGVSIMDFFVSDMFWSGLTEEQQDIILSNCQATAAELNETYYVKKAESTAFLEEQGVTFVEPTEEEVAQIIEAVSPTLVEHISAYATEDDLAELRALAE